MIEVYNPGGSSTGTNKFDATVEYVNQSVTGAINGVNKIYTTPTTYVAGSLEVFRNGVLQVPGTDYTETTDTTFTFVTAPTGGNTLRVNYQFAIQNIQGNDVVYADRTASDATYDYYGEADPNIATSAAAWRIRRLRQDGTGGVLYADGVKTFTKIWNNYLTYTYS